MKSVYALPLLAGALLASGCTDLTVPEYNNPLLADLQTNPTSGVVNATATGLLDASRQDAQNYIRYTGVLGREGYFIDPNESRYITELVQGSMDPSSFAGGGIWTGRYRTIRSANVLLEALGKLPSTDDLSPTQKEGIRGFAKLMQAHDLLQVINTRESAPIDIPADPKADPAPFASRAQVFERIYKLLDESHAHLGAAGTTFSFSLPSGFSQFGFTTPARMRQVNRAIRSRVDILNRDYTQAVTDLGGSFVSTTATDRAGLNAGVYYNFSNAAGDLPNSLATATSQVADTLLRRDAQLRADNTRDTRYGLKVESRGAPRTFLNVTSDLRFRNYRTSSYFGGTNASAPIPIVRNEELILNRAEARWFTGDKTGAMADLNFVRTNSGGLAAITTVPGSDTEFRDLLLYERRYSLLFEGGFRWLDLRRFDLLSTLDNYPRAGDKAARYFPVPFAECLARPAGTPGCSAK